MAKQRLGTNLNALLGGANINPTVAEELSAETSVIENICFRGR